MDETYGTHVYDECFDIHDYDVDTDHDTDDGGRGNRRPLGGGAEFISQMMIYDETLILDLVLSRNRLQQLQNQHTQVQDEAIFTQIPILEVPWLN